MDSKDIKKTLMQEAREMGICKEGYNSMRVTVDIDEIIDYYIKNPDWCMERSFPSKHLLDEYFRRYQHKGIYIDSDFDNRHLNDKLVYIFHNCKGNIRTSLNLEKSLIPMLYFANGCNMNIHCDENIKIPLYIFGHNNIRTSGRAKFIIFRHELLNREEE